MAQPFAADDPYLAAGFEPIRMECDYADLAISGEVPAELNGSFYRIGPNPQFVPRGVYNPLMGDGMIHAFHVHNQTVSYRNRWVRTQQWTMERAAKRALFATSGNPRDADPTVARMPTDGVANTNLVWHAGKLLALEDSHAPIEIDPITLETRGVWTFDGHLRTNMTAHPKVDPETGEMVFFANLTTRKLSGEIALYVVDTNGELIRNEIFQGPFAAFVHDFAVTRDFVVFIVCPITLSMERVRAGKPPIAWEPEQLTHVGVLPRTGRAADICWHKVPACMVWHTLNAFNDANTITVDVCRQQAPAFARVDGQGTGRDELRQYLTRWTFDTGPSRAFVSTRLSEIVCEYPRFDERRAGLPYRYAYFACDGGPGTDDVFHRGIARFDHLARTMAVYHAGRECSVTEPVFVPQTPDAGEGDGYLLSVIFDEHRNRSHLAIFDARQVERGPIARVLLDHRVPGGFHGIWRPAVA